MLNQTDTIAEWMAENGGGIAECAHCLGIPKDTVKSTWKRIRRRLGSQAI